MSKTKKIKDEDEVYFCSSCLSLAIIIDNGVEYCKKCGCAIINKATIEEWEKLCKEKYPKQYIPHSRNIFVKKERNKYYDK